MVSMRGDGEMQEFAHVGSAGMEAAWAREEQGNRKGCERWNETFCHHRGAPSAQGGTPCFTRKQGALIGPAQEGGADGESCADGGEQDEVAFFQPALLARGLLGARQQSVPVPQADTEPNAESASPFAAARSLLQSGRYEEAISSLQALSAARPSVRGLDRELGVVYYKKADYLNAISSLNRALQEDAKDNEATQLLGLSYYLAGRPAEAIPYLEKVQSWFARANVDASYILGICYIQSKDYARARIAFARMFEVPPASYPRVEQGGTILKWAADVDAARAFRGFLLSADGQAILKQFGFSVPDR